MDLTTFTIPANASLIEAASRCATNGSRTVVVVEGDKVVGLIAEGDILRAMANGSDIYAPLAEHATTNFKYLRRRDLAQALPLFRKHTFGLLPILDEGFRLVDVITLGHLLAAVEISDSPAG